MKLKFINPDQINAFDELPQTESKQEKSSWSWYRFWKDGKKTAYICKAPNEKVAFRAFEAEKLTSDDVCYGTPKVEDDFFKNVPPNFLGKSKMVTVALSKNRKLQIKLICFQEMK
jgi:hypothetical protein